MESSAVKKPKLEKDELPAAYGGRAGDEAAEAEEEDSEEAVVALVAHRERDVEHCQLKLLHYQTLLDSAEKKLAEAHARLARIRARPSGGTAAANAKAEASPGPNSRPPPPSPAQAPSPVPRTPQPQPQPASRPQLVIPAVNTRPAPQPRPPVARTEPVAALKRPAAPATLSASSSPARSKAVDRPRQEEKKVKRKIEQKEHQNLIPSIRSSTAKPLRFQTGTILSSQHKRKLRCLELCPVNDQLVVTSALDGMVTLWQVQAKGPSASLLSTTDCFSPKHRWPEDLSWHPDGDRIFAVYSADGGDSQISMINLNVSGQKKVMFLEAKPHLKGIINSINFMPWTDPCFVTGGSDHALMLWQEKEDSWNHKKIHRDLHSSAIMGVAGLQQRQTILSAGADKRIIAFDPSVGRTEFKNQIDSKCMSVLPNPCDFNLYMVQSATPGKQLRLFDIRLRQTEIHAFGWKQESSDSQSALINQSWSPDGWYLSSGSADPMIHIFDIRQPGRNPSQSVQAHQKRVFKAVWHQTAPLLTSISSDLNIGIHKIY